MAPSWCKHLDELVNGSQMLPPRAQFLSQIVEKPSLFKDICFHQSLAQCSAERIGNMAKMELNEHFNLSTLKQELVAAGL